MALLFAYNCSKGRNGAIRTAETISWTKVSSWSVSWAQMIIELWDINWSSLRIYILSGWEISLWACSGFILAINSATKHTCIRVHILCRQWSTFSFRIEPQSLNPTSSSFYASFASRSFTWSVPSHLLRLWILSGQLSSYGTKNLVGKMQWIPYNIPWI